MYKLITIALLSFAFLKSYSQCDRSVTCTALVGRFVTGSGKAEEMPLEAIIKIDKENIVLDISIGGQTQTITNKINSVDTCKWEEYLKQGSTVYKVTTTKVDNHTENSIVKITGKAGKLTIYLGSDPDDKGGLELDINQTKFEN